MNLLVTYRINSGRKKLESMPWGFSKLLLKYQSIKMLLYRTSHQDGGVDRYTLLPPTTKRRMTTNLKTKNNQTCQKIKQYGSLKTKELKKKHSSKLVGGAEKGSWGGEDVQEGSDWRSKQSHICILINWEEQLGARQTAQPRVPVQANKASKPLTQKTCGDCGSGTNSQPHRRVHW